MNTEWTGDLDDDCRLRTEGGYRAHAENMGAGEWYCSVWILTGPNMDDTRKRQVFHSTEHDIRPLTGNAARALCQIIIDADRWRERDNDK